MTANPARTGKNWALLASVAVALVASACGEETITRYRPPFQVVDGTPSVEQGQPDVDLRPPTVDPTQFANNAPVQVDAFTQKTVRKVDILWMVDNSGSMDAEQANLAANFGSFITDLTSAQPPVDYHLGVITTDASGEGGALRPIATNPAVRYIACTDPSNCNVSDPGAAFEQTIAVGTGGGAVEKGLLAAHLALTEPMISTKNAGFLRPEAALYVIFVSDEGDGSCEPALGMPAGDDRTSCTTFGPYCRCADDLTEGYGSVDYFVRFFEGLKGYGNSDLVATAAIVSTEQDRLTNLCVMVDAYGQCTRTATYSGCRGTSASEYAFHAPRYLQVAARTGGIATSICNSDFSQALQALGFAVSGQRREFPLARRPVDPNIKPLRVTLQTDPTDPATKAEVPLSGTDGFQYVQCENGVWLNAVRFHGSWVPPPLSRVEVTYQVDIGGGRTCN